MNKELIEEYCTGCGLCKSVYSCDLKYCNNGYFTIDSDKLTNDQVEKLEKICPVFGNQIKSMDSKFI